MSKKKRRQRSAAGERNYMCGCRKAYLSYPALYTHVKNKHEGIFPIGSNAKRKIPKNFEEETDNVFIPNLDKFYAEFQEFIAQVPGAEGKGKSPLAKEVIDKLFQFTVPGMESEIGALKTHMKSMSVLESDKARFEASKDSLTIYQILAYYLVSVYSYCSESFFREYSHLILMILKSLNDKGEMFIEKDEKKKPGAKGDDGATRFFCDGLNIHVASEILNLFIAELFPALLKSFKTAGINFDFLGFEDEHIKNLIVMTKYLANWLFNHEFTDYRLEINVDL
jgi:hypothetical protein